MPRPKEWFDNPLFGSSSPDFSNDEDDPRLSIQEPDRDEEEVTYGAALEVTGDGQIFGHAALWGRCHVGFGGTCVRPPKEEPSYSGYLVGSAVDGVRTGPLVLGTGHAPLTANAKRARAWYDDTGTAVADVTVGPDHLGIWVAGGIRAGATDDDMDALKGSALSGDWRVLGSGHKLIGLLAVNSPGFRINRSYALAASSAIITVGPGCADCQHEDSPDYQTLEHRVQVLESVVASGIRASIE